jgi:hypothetical protein
MLLISDIGLIGLMSNMVYLPDDGQVSHRNVIVEVKPPDTRIRDFGNRNGAFVNDKKIRGRLSAIAVSQSMGRFRDCLRLSPLW